MRYITYSLFLGMSILLFSCKNETKSVQPELKVAPTASQVIDTGAIEEVTFKKEEATAVFNDYIALKNALVQTDAVVSSHAASGLVGSLKKIGSSEKAILVSKEIANATDIEIQRKHFVDITAMIESMLEKEVAKGTFYKQYCPMAFKNTGAYWLSNSKEIRNPYFGDKMLKCGRVDKEIN
jgi:hypothetical protein